MKTERANKNTRTTPAVLVLLSLTAFFVSAVSTLETARAQAEDAGTKSEAGTQIDMQRARELMQKQRGGGTLTAEESAYLEKARAMRRTQMGNRPPGGARPERPAGGGGKTSMDIVPLTDMSGDDTYKGQSGGLYGEGRNEPPAALKAAADAAVARIQPLDAEGKPAEDGKIVMISNGMSNTTQEFGQFVRLANGDDAKNPNLVIVDGAIGGQEASDWADPNKRSRSEKPSPWEVLDQRIERAGVTPQQVQVLWVKQARRQPASLGEFPKHAEVLKDNLAEVIRMMKERFPNLQVAYLSSRIYAGYAAGDLNPEPYAFEGAFSVRWLIEDQLKGEPGLNYDPEKGEVKAPVILWGPYLWANGEEGRKAGDLVWKQEDFGKDGTHPSEIGREKVAKLLLDFFKSDETARAWFVGS